jgi:hypothetical protein
MTDDSFIIKRRDYSDIAKLQDPGVLEEFLDEPLTFIAETITGALATGATGSMVMARIGNWADDSIHPADYCYNRTNKAARSPEYRVFLWVKRGHYKYVGRQETEGVICPRKLLDSESLKRREPALEVFQVTATPCPNHHHVGIDLPARFTATGY